MTSRERVLQSLRHEEPDRVPYNIRPCDSTRQNLRDETGDPNVVLEDYFAHDVRYVGIPLPEPPKGLPKWEWSPRPASKDITACAAEVARLRRTGVAVCGAYACGVFEQMKDWFGDVDTLTMPYDDPAKLELMLNRITEWKIATCGAYVEAGVDMVWIGDDLGAQKSLIMSPEIYRQWYRPCHERIVRHLRRVRPEVRIVFHCCGHVTPLIPDLIEVGIDVLEAVQPEAMDHAQLKREFGRDISFWGGIGLQHALSQATPQSITGEIRSVLSILAPGGGYIAAPCHTLTDDMPWENVKAFYQAMREYGTYGG